MQKPIAYEVRNRITGEARRYKTSGRATAAMNKADSAYGAYITSRRAVWEGEA